MTERRLTFIDADENLLVVWLKEDRVQLTVVDSHPELEAAELRAFAAALFAAYVGGPLAAQLDAARGTIGDVRDRLAATAGSDALATALDDSLRAIEEVSRVIVGAKPGIAPGPEPATPPPAAALEASPSNRQIPPPARRKRARERRGSLGWGWVRHRDPTPATRS